MPIYQIVTSGVDLDLDQRDRLAKGVTAIHHDETDAPEPFVRVVFQPLPLGLIYTAGEIAPSLVVACSIRAGRSEVVRRHIITRVYDLVAEVTALEGDQIVIALNETVSGWLIEGGMIMPEATHEAESAWMARLDEMFPGKYASYV